MSILTLPNCYLSAILLFCCICACALCLLSIVKLPRTLQNFWWHEFFQTQTTELIFCQALRSRDVVGVAFILTSMLVVLYFYYGSSIPFYLLVLLCNTLIILAYFDYRYFLLPDVFILPLFAVGLLCNLQHAFCSINSAVCGAIVGYALLSCSNAIYYWRHKHAGLGQGDSKLAAMLGSWFGMIMLFHLLCLACVIGIIYHIMQQLYDKQATRKIPFGSCLVMATFVLLFIH